MKAKTSFRAFTHVCLSAVAGIASLAAAEAGPRLDEAREFFKNGHCEGPKCEMLDSGLGTGGKLPVFDLGRYVAECPGLVGEKGFTAAVMFLT